MAIFVPSGRIVFFGGGRLGFCLKAVTTDPHTFQANFYQIVWYKKSQAGYRLKKMIEKYRRSDFPTLP
jgi:hypothetical protein